MYLTRGRGANAAGKYMEYTFNLVYSRVSRFGGPVFKSPLDFEMGREKSIGTSGPRRRGRRLGR